MKPVLNVIFILFVYYYYIYYIIYSILLIKNIKNIKTSKFRKTPVVGITSLGFDHTAVLGDKLEDIAWQKSGIMKPNSIAIVSNNQPKETHQMLIERSMENQVHKKFYSVNKYLTSLIMYYLYVIIC